MSFAFLMAMARRDGRSTRRRLGLYIAAIALGVAALVAITSFRAGVSGAVEAQARTLLGADLRLDSRWDFPPDVELLIDSLVSEGAELARVTTFATMALATRSGLTRLLQLRAVSGGYPFYGDVTTEPPGLWPQLDIGHRALVDPAVLVQLEARIGDTLVVGAARFEIAGTVTRLPGDVGLRAAIAPRVYVSARHLEETGLLRFGSVAWRLAYLKLGDAALADRIVEAEDSLLRANRVSHSTASGRAEYVGEYLHRLTSFLALVGLVALFLGGIAVASGVHLYVSEKLDTAAVLRCLGARERLVFGVYLAQAAMVGLLAAVLGSALGIAVQAVLPSVLRDFLPLDVPFRVRWAAVLAGLAIGVGVAVLFALLPLFRIKDVSPLRALRRDFERAPRPRDPWRLSTYAALGLSSLALTVWQAPGPVTGLLFAAAAVVTVGALGLSGFALTRLARRLFPRRAGYALRQGLANLFRPQNQTVAVTLAIGSGVFLIATLYVVQRNLLNPMTPETRPDRPNLLIFDIQPNQFPGVKAILSEHGAPALQRTPLVSARLTRVGERPVTELLADTSVARSARWALVREYRHTYRDTLVRSERIVAGAWFDQGRPPRGDEPARVSIEESIAQELNVGVGDRLSWEIQGVPVETRITSVRHVDWARFEPNFYFVFEPGALDGIPQSFVVLARSDEPTRRAEIQRDIVLRYPNVAAIDLAAVIEAIDSILDKVALAIRFMALFSIASGLVILAGAVATSRCQRTRESVLLKTLGATSGTLTTILATEYAALGSVAGLSGVTLAAVAGWAAVTFLFKLTFHLPAVPLLAFWAGTTLLTAAIGLLGGREAIRRTPLAGMRDFAE